MSLFPSKLMNWNLSKSHNSRADKIISEIIENGTFTLRPRKLMNTILFLLYLALTASGVEFFLAGESFGLVIAGFFGIGVFLYGCKMISYRCYLLLYPEGFDVHFLWSTDSFQWADIKYITTYCTGLYLRVFYYVLIGHSALDKSVTRPFWKEDIDETPIHGYGMNAKELAALLTKLQKHFLNQEEYIRRTNLIFT